MNNYTVYIHRNTVNNKAYCVELNEIFESARKASEELGIGQGNISGCCTGKWRKAGGYHFEYV